MAVRDEIATCLGMNKQKALTRGRTDTHELASVWFDDSSLMHIKRSERRQMTP